MRRASTDSADWKDCSSLFGSARRAVAAPMAKGGKTGGGQDSAVRPSANLLHLGPRSALTGEIEKRRLARQDDLASATSSLGIWFDFLGTSNFADLQFVLLWR